MSGNNHNSYLKYVSDHKTLHLTNTKGRVKNCASSRGVAHDNKTLTKYTGRPQCNLNFETPYTWDNFLELDSSVFIQM